MNEIKKIHLDRQPFTISVEAHQELRSYLAAIERQVGPKGQDVLKEIELRMAELLAERGVAGDKVVLPEDVEFLKEQLGKPGDFKDDDLHGLDGAETTAGHDASADETGHAAGTPHTDADDQPKRLYRDPENAMIAGVASGLAAYFRIDPLIVRLTFVVLLLTGGAGIITYILLWILVPEAKTPSERLQMRGKAVTVDNIKRLVDRADLPAAANRTRTLISRILSVIAKVFLAIVGIGIALSGIATIVWSFISAVYWALHDGQLGTDFAFPTGTREVVLLAAGLITAAMIGLMLTLVGIAMITRKWKIPAWATASIVGLFFISTTVGAALAFDTFPAVRQRFRDAHKLQTRSLSEFKNLELRGNDTKYVFKPSDGYSVTISYIGNPESKTISTKVEGDTLQIDTSGFEDRRFCSGLCFYNDKDLEVTIYAPVVGHVSLWGEDASFKSSEVLRQNDLTIETKGSNSVDLGRMKPTEVRLAIKDSGEMSRTLQLQNIRSNEAASEDSITLREERSVIEHADSLEVTLPHTCDTGDPILFMGSETKTLRINDSDIIHGVTQLKKLQNRDVSNDYNCIATN
jgi:phage shock protein PspC (stress-responsive transcriptional regulator)